MGVDVGRVDLQSVDHELTRIDVDYRLASTVWTVDFISADCVDFLSVDCVDFINVNCGLCGLYKCGLRTVWTF